MADIAPAPPANGVLRFFTSLDESLMERLQREFPDARLVKAFNSVGSALMVDPQLPGGKPTMFLCGNDEGAKQQASDIVRQFGWEAADLGPIAASRYLEAMCIAWVMSGAKYQTWNIAFKMLRA